MTLSEQEIIRRKKLKELDNIGIEAYPSETFNINCFINEIINNYEENKNICIAGRIMRIRIMGKASFAEIKDNSGSIQLYLSDKIISKYSKKIYYNVIFKKILDLGDIIGVEGFLSKTKTQEITVYVKKFKLLSKSIKPLPQVKINEVGKIYDSFSDPEQRYRMRYVDIIVNESIKNIFFKRSLIIQSIRNYLNKYNFLEVETPILQPIPGGANAKAFITHHNYLNMPLYLRIANELYLKRLIIAGFYGVYEFSKNFRNEGMDRTHNPEFTVLELYVSYKDYYWMMDFIEKLLEKLSIILNGNTNLKLDNKVISFKKPYPRIPIYESIKKYTGFDISNLNEDELIEICKKLNIKLNKDKDLGKGKIIDKIFKEKCEEKYIQPTFIIDYPIELSPLSKKHRKKIGLSERFELFINGQEIANAYSELNDPIDQLNRFKDQLKLSEKGDDEAMFIDYDFVNALEFGMPPTSGIGIGIDRLVMIFTNQKSIQEVLFFPQMKLKKINN